MSNESIIRGLIISSFLDYKDKAELLNYFDELLAKAKENKN